MPEIISKHPDLAIAVLKAAGMDCSSKNKPAILQACPKDRLCSLTNGKGELCIYTPNEVSSMTQVTSFDFINYPSLALPAAALGIFIFIAGMMAGMKLK